MSRFRPTRGHALCLALLLVLLALSSCADERKIWFENQRDQVVTVSIDGDRLVILAPHKVEPLPYTTAAWAWPRRIEVRTWSGEPLFSEYFDADDLTRQGWVITVRP